MACSALQSAGRAPWWSSLPWSDVWHRNETRLAPVQHDESSTTTTATKVEARRSFRPVTAGKTGALLYETLQSSRVERRGEYADVDLRGPDSRGSAARRRTRWRSGNRGVSAPPHTEKVSDTTRAIGMPAILDSSSRVCPESSPTITSFPQEFGRCDGLKNRRLSLFFLGILAGTRRYRAQCARKCARCREAHPRLRATPQSTHVLDTYASKAAVFNAGALL